MGEPGSGDLGVPDPLRFSLSTHTLEHMPVETLAGCGYEQATGTGDQRPTLTKQHAAADAARSGRGPVPRQRACAQGASHRT
jgi:molybdopterin-synthase adenylyltransferase